MKNFLFVFFLLPLLAFNGAHKFYVSATDIEYNEEVQSLQIISHVFTDDLENLLKNRYSKDIFLTKEKEHSAADRYIERYFREKFKISVNGKDRTLNYIGKQYDNDQILIYIEVEDVEPISTITVGNEVLTDLFPDQKNVIKVEYGGEIKSLLLMRDAASGTLKFKN